MNTQFWLARLDRHGNPTLIDGAHEGRAGVEKAMYLFNRLGLGKGERYACAEVVITEVEPRSHGANEDALSALKDAYMPTARQDYEDTETVVEEVRAFLSALETPPLHKEEHSALMQVVNEGAPEDENVYAVPVPVPVTITDAARDVLAERKRQVEAEGWTPEHDDEHSGGEIAVAAGLYAIGAGYQNQRPGVPFGWPWAPEWWKPTTRRRDLVKAGALILAEIERLDRAALSQKPGEQG